MLKYRIIIIPLFLFSCDCTVDQYGVVVDSKTKIPIEGAKVNLSKWTTTTDSIGKFEFHIVTTDYGYHEYEQPVASKYNPKIKENGSYFDLI